MSKLGLVRTLARPNLNVRTSGSNLKHGNLTPFLRNSPRGYYTESETSGTRYAHSYLYPGMDVPSPSLDSAYGRIFGVTRYTLKTDIIKLLEGCNLGLDDVKVEYNWNFNPIAMLVHFCIPQAYNQAYRMIAKRGHLFRIERATKVEWDHVAPYDGRTVLLQGIPRGAVEMDVERFLSGCEYDAMSIQIFSRVGSQNKMATVRFPSQTQAMNCFITKNRGFCMNKQILVCVLQ